ncbi:hypothetical protein [Oceanobacillus sp. FSL W7-1293]|uniref:hypothetical protein n=1 Tax=Oceanobacillus sp. FSL W7-1293 TaxID=2921699 RepID=UPI0030D4D882
MGLKVLTLIKLPYTLRMKESKEIIAKLKPTNEFSQFNITFYPNSQDYEEYYNPHYPNNSCLFIEIEAVTELYDAGNYKVYDNNDYYHTLEVPEENRKLIFEMLRKKLNSYLQALNEHTKMFWIEDLPMNPLSSTIGKTNQFMFLNANQEVKTSSRFWWKTLDDYQIELEAIGRSIYSIDESIVNKCDQLRVLGHPWRTHLNKAKVALFESQFNEFIIYCSIASESFIKQLTMPKIYGLENDIILKKLVRTGNNKIVDSYYNVILKYIFGKSLEDVNPNLYKGMNTLYQFRNALMHNGEISKKELKKAGYQDEEDLTFSICKNMFESLDETFSTVLEIMESKIK